MSTTPSAFEQMQLDSQGCLQSLDAFYYVPVQVIRPRGEGSAVQIQTEIDNILKGYSTQNGKNGLTVIIGMASGDVDHPDASGPEFVPTLPIRVFENPMVNMGATGTGISCETTALEVAVGLHKFSTGPTFGELYVPKGGIVPLPEYLKEEMVAYEVRLASRFRIAPRTRVRTPVIAGDHTAFTLSSATPGASIFYTTDGTFPGQTATPYPGAAITTLPAGTQVRAAAYATNQPGSCIAAQILT